MVAPNPFPPPSSPPSAIRGAPPSGGGTSRMVPVVVSAGLAVGVFAGLLFGLGTGDDVAHAGRTIKAGSGSGEAFDIGIDEFEGKDVALPPDAGPIDAPAVVVPTTKIARLTFEIEPPGAKAKITLNGKDVESEAEIDITDGAKSVELVVKARGFIDYKEQVSVDGDDTVKIKLDRRAIPPGPLPQRPPRRNDNRNDGRIDI
jgi:hypothetical protein